MKPTIGRIVHYQSFGTPGGEHLPEPRAAIVTQVRTVDRACAGEPPAPVEVASLCVLNPTGMFFNTDVPYSPTPKPGHWNWPPRDEPTLLANTVRGVDGNLISTRTLRDRSTADC